MTSATGSHVPMVIIVLAGLYFSSAGAVCGSSRCLLLFGSWKIRRAPSRGSCEKTLPRLLPSPFSVLTAETWKVNQVPDLCWATLFICTALATVKTLLNRQKSFEVWGHWRYKGQKYADDPVILHPAQERTHQWLIFRAAILIFFTYKKEKTHKLKHTNSTPWPNQSWSVCVWQVPAVSIPHSA